MKISTSLILLTIAFVLLSFTTIGQNVLNRDGDDSNWSEVEMTSIENFGKRYTIPVKYRVYELDIVKLKKKLDQAPVGDENIKQGIIIDVPSPSGELLRLKVVNTPIFAPELLEETKFIQTFSGYNVDSPSESVKIDYTSQGIHIMILTTQGGGIFIDPYQTEDTLHYISYFKNNLKSDETFECLVGELESVKKEVPDINYRSQGSCQLKTYRLAIAATGEYTSFHGGLAGAQSAIVTTMNRVNGLFARDAGIKMTIISGTNIIFTNSSTDPYSNNDGGAMLSQNQTTIDNAYGYANYDIGHVFSTGGGGVAYQRACASSLKAGGVTGSGSPVGDAFDVDYVAHEMGHQYGADHTFNEPSSGSCGGGNRSAGTAYEPGSGSSILAYAGICSPRNVQNNSDALYHAASILQMSSHIANYPSCGVTSNSGNTAPTANAGSNYTVPKTTPFTLTAVGTDIDSDALTYTWEQYDLESTGTTPPSTTDTDGPNFRTYLPTTSPSRTFPRIQDVIANTQWPTWEVIPSISKTMNFKLTVRDNSTGGYGCTDMDDMTVTTDVNSGPFVVNIPSNTGISYTGNSSQTVTWTVASTNVAPVSCANVDILISTDGGLTFPTVLASNVPNDGSQVITIPNTATTTARVKVICSDNIFFDISNNNFTITASLFDYTLSATSSTSSVCPPTNGTYTINVGSIGGFSDAVSLSVSGNPAGTSASFSPSSVTPGGSSTLTISNTASATPGSYTLTVQGNSTTGTKSISLTLIIADGSPTAVTLSSPANGATGVAIPVAFSWTASAGAGTVYDIDIATDAGFTNIVDNATGLSTNSYSSATLSSSTTYYWRVRAYNSCASAAFSNTFSFSTSSCSTLMSTNVPRTISSSGTPTVTSTLSVGIAGSITDINVVSLIGTHSWINDMTVTLTSPTGTAVVLWARICNDENNFNLNFDDQAASSTLPCPPIGGGTYQPLGSLADFNGEDPSGTWTLTINDAVDQDGGSLTSWGLEICVTPPSNCSVTASVNNDVSCNGGNDGSATIAPSNGTSPYVYSWSGGGSNQTKNTLSAGVHTITVTDAGSCNKVTTVTITQPTSIVLSNTSTSVSCNGGSNGAVNLSVSGGTPNYNYLWSNGATTQDISGVIKGTYSVTATDDNGCQASTSIVINEPSAITLSLSHTDELCGSGNGSATASVSGGTPGYNYNWSTGGMGTSISSLSANTYGVTVGDINGCSTSQSVEILAVTGPSAMLSSTNAICNTNGSATVSVSGGTTPYVYSWSNGATGATITGVSSNLYTVTVTDDNVCKDVQSISVGNTINSIPYSGNFLNEICSNSNGAITITPSGGSAPYTYNWNNGATTSIIDNLSAATFTVTISDINSCSSVANVTISNSISTVSANLSSADDVCGNTVGTASAVGNGGISPYAYLWNTGATTSAITGLNAGSFSVTVTDNNNCSYINSINVVSTSPSTTISSTITDASCNSANGEIMTDASGGTSPYAYNWNNFATTSDISSIVSGSYAVTVTDANNCVVTMPFVVSNISGISTSITGVNETCTNSNGSASVAVTGGTTPYTYNWTNGNTAATANNLSSGVHNITISDALSCYSFESITLSNSIQSVSSTKTDAHCGQVDGTATLMVTGGLTPYTYLWNDAMNQTVIGATGLIANSYIATVTDGNGCLIIENVTINDIAGPGSAISSSNENCGLSNGSASVTATGGSTPYFYLWSNSATTSTINGLSANSYLITISDVFGCISISSTTISNIGGPILSMTSTDATCIGGDGTASVNVSGGATPLSYLWNDGLSQNTSTASNLNAGNYTVTVTDGGGCISQAAVTVSASSSKKYTVDITTPNCSGENVTWQILDASLNVVASGTMGRGETKTWDVCDCGETFVLNAPPKLSGGNPATRCPANIAPGSANIYDDLGVLIGSTDIDGGTVSLIGKSGCSYTCPTITVNTTKTDISCNGLNDGTAVANPTGGSTPYSYTWSNFVTTQSITGLSASNYLVTTTDINGCAGAGSITINEPVMLTTGITNVSVTCYNGNDGSAMATPTGGTTPYSYIWSNGNTTSNPGSLVSNNYQVTVIDANNCSVIASTTITEAPQIIITSSVNDAICSGNNGSITVSVNFGNTPYSYSWSSGGTTATEVNLGQGSYAITVLDVNSCNETLSISVGNQNIIFTVTDVVSNAQCGLSNGSVTVSANGGSSPYSYSWSSGGSNSIENGLSQGVFTVTVADVNGCNTVYNSTIGNDNGQSITVTSNPSTCGNANGTATVIVSGGVSPYFYNWSTGGTTSSENNILAGSHIVSVTDNSGCLAVGNFTVSNMAGASISISTTDATCNSSNGEASALIAGGTTPYSFAWSAGSNTATQTGLGAGSISVTVTDGNSCATSSIAFVNNVFPTVVTVTSTNETCSASNGNASIQVTGGTTPYNYGWSSGSTTNISNGLSNGIYNVTVVDAANCIVFESFNITDAPSPIIATSVTDAACGQTNGSATVYVTSGGTTPFSYLWSTGGTFATENPLAANTYFVTVTDANNCSVTSSAAVNNVAGPIATVITTNTACNVADGTATVNATGGITPYTYAWSTGGAGKIIAGLSQNTYFVTVTDVNNCKTTQSGVVNQTPNPAILISGSDAHCGNNDGTASITISSGTPAYSTLWSSGGNTTSVTNLLAGNYSVTVTDSKGCKANENITINNISGPSISTTFNDETCGNSNGDIVAIVSGGITPYAYFWSAGSTTTSQTGLSAGTYGITVTDSNSCSASSSVVISNVFPAIISVSAVDESCSASNGSISVGVTGGITPYLYSWTSGNTTNTAIGLSGGITAVTITDSVGCLVLQSFTITDQISPSVIASAVDAACGQPNGSATVVVNSGGTSPFTYNWSTGGITATVNNLVSNLYSVTVSDANNCNVTASATVNNIAGPTVSVTTTNTSCNVADGTATAMGAGGATPYSYIWSNAGAGNFIGGLAQNTFTVTVTDSNNCAASQSGTVNQSASPTILISKSDAHCGMNDGAASITISDGTPAFSTIWSSGGNSTNETNLLSGNYSVTVTDSKGCKATESITILNIAGPSVALNVTDATCGSDNGSITSIITGGVTPYNYIWTGAKTTSNINALATGNYSITVNDNVGCSTIASVFVGNNVPVINISVTSELCGLSNGTASISPSSGLTPYSYNWFDGYSGNSRNDLSAGNHLVTVTDGNSCVSVKNITISSGGGAISLTATEIPETCGMLNGSASVQASGGTTPYSYSWSNVFSGETQTGLQAGNYIITVTDFNSCLNTIIKKVNSISGPTATLNIINATCNQNNGEISVSVSSGTTPYTYSWSNGNNNPVAQNLIASGYSVTIIDANGCTVTENGTVTDPGLAIVNVTASDAACGQSNGSINTTVNGGKVPYTFDWSSGGNLSSETGLLAGSYSLSVTDDNNCLVTATATVGTISGPAIVETVSGASCGNPNGAIATTISGGTSPFVYAWSNGTSGTGITSLLSAAYAVTVIDANNCIAIDNYVVGDSPLPVVNITSTDAACGQANGSITAIVTTGTAPYFYLWNNNATTEILSGIVSGGYSVTVTDNKSCVVTTTDIVTNLSGPSASVTTTDETCANSNGTATAITSGGANPYMFLWNNNATTSNITGLPANTYTVTVTDNNNCIAVVSGALINISGPSINITTTNAACGNNNGSATAIATSGTSPISYVWNTGGTTTTISNLFASTYFVTVSDGNGCSVTGQANVSNDTPTVSTSITDARCGLSNGSVEIIASGGVTPYVYNWSNGNSTSLATNLLSNLYSVTVLDDNNCVAIQSISIGDTPVLDINITTTVATCNQANGSVEAIINNGTAPYLYSWNNGITTSSQTGISAGTYAITVSDNNSCVAFGSGFVNNNIPTISVNTTNATCGNNNGNALVAVSGGVIPYSYNWSSGGSNSIESNLLSGTYIVTVADASGCIFIKSITVGETAGPSVSHVTSEASCGVSNGSATVTASGGSTPYTYLWSSGGNSSTETGLAAGVYQVIIIDKIGCMQTEDIEITNTGAPTVSINGTNATCGAANGQASVSISGGQSPYDVLWNTGSTSLSINGLNAGNFTATIIDDNACVSVKSITITQTGLPILTLNATDEKCDATNGAVSISVSSGSILSYLWSTGATSSTISGLAANTYSVSVVDNNSCNISAQTTVINTSSPELIVSTTSTLCGSSTGDIAVTINGGSIPYAFNWSNGSTTLSQSGLVSGTYSITASDNNNCLTIENITITASAPPSVTVTALNELCGLNNGNASIIISGGTTPYLFNWSDGKTTGDAANLSAGSYYLTITDNNNCAVTDSALILNIQPEMALVATNSNCDKNNGEISTIVTEGLPPYNYSWSNGKTTFSIELLAVGDYTVTVVDANGCILSETSTIVNVDDLQVSITGVNASCGLENGEATAVASGGKTPYSYSWNTTETTETISNLSPIFYSVLLTDASNCFVTANVELFQSEGIAIELSVEQVNCDGNNGEISVYRTGGTPPITYNWSNGDDGFFLENLTEGEYILTTTDANNCMSIDTAIVEKISGICISIPTGFTPNGDGVNELWNIKGSTYYSDITVEVYNRWGSLLFSSKGYESPWDGTYNGKQLPSAVYYFIINVPSEEFSQTGTITIRR